MAVLSAVFLGLRPKPIKEKFNLPAVELSMKLYAANNGGLTAVLNVFVYLDAGRMVNSLYSG